MAKGKAKGKRKCSLCEQPGHNVRNCPSKPKKPEPVKPKKAGRKTDKEIGRAILAKEGKKEARQEIAGLKPKTGLWIINVERKKIAGRITQVKRNGDIVRKTAHGATIATPQKLLKEEGYSYVEQLEVEMLIWRIM